MRLTLALIVSVGLLPAVAGSAHAKRPKVKSKAAIAIDAETGAEVFGKAADEIRPIASTTKIFVAMAVRHRGLSLDGWTQILKSDAKAARGGARTRLDVGELFNNKDLLRAMLMASDNRAPTALGRAAGLGPDELISEMNAVAKRLGLKKTKFTDTSGLRGNVSTAREMALALRATLEDDVLREIMHDTQEEVESKSGKRKVEYTNTNTPLLGRRFDVIGGKTGFTDPAGYCLVSAAKLNGRPVVLAFYGAPEKQDRFDDFYTVAGWIEDGAQGAPVTLRAPAATSAEARRDKSATTLKASGRAKKKKRS
ncbi:MAG: D-alanyl-D-alanine carboxypeptidase [Kofleriaceae bacterium]|nr:D-alanyl-D-alanine carboxypeptidase [Kofleriaceae bacterium]